MTALDDAWQAALAAEHRAVFGYGLLGPRLADTEIDLAVACSAAHETARDDTEAALAAAGRSPVGPAADYPALYPVPDAAAARALAVRLEDTAAAAWRYLYAQAAGAAGPDTRARTARTLRSAAQAQLTACAVRAVRWRALVDPTRASRAFPGL